MRVLVINSGSSTLKFDLLDVSVTADTYNHSDAGSIRRIAHGLVDRIGHDPDSAIHFVSASGLDEKRDLPIKDHHAAVAHVVAWLKASAERDPALGEPVEAVGHRVVHGGSRFVEPVLINDTVIADIEELSELAPLHNPPALQGIRAAREGLGPNVPMVAVFDTAFHAGLPDFAYTYAIPRDLAQRYKIRRYGFHGIAHKYMLLRYSKLAPLPVERCTIITMQLGNGCSIAAIKDGRSVDISMGFTPLEGLVMGTRSGDLDPGIIAYLCEKAGVGAREVEEWLNKRSGLLGISGRSGDMRDLLSAMEEVPAARLAIDVFCYRLRKYIGAYMAALDGAQAIVFGGGIGENAVAIRARICEGMEWCGLHLDAQRNESIAGKEGEISAENSPVHAYVILVDESALVAQDTAALVTNG